MLGVIFGVMDLELESTIFETDVAVHDRLQWLFYIICLQKKICMLHYKRMCR